MSLAIKRAKVFLPLIRLSSLLVMRYCCASCSTFSSAASLAFRLVEQLMRVVTKALTARV